MELKIGQIVISKAGRDKRRPFVVIEVIDNEYVYIVDGDLRKLSRPKKKKIKHLQKTNSFVLQKIYIDNEIVINNKQIYECLSNFSNKCI